MVSRYKWHLSSGGYARRVGANRQAVYLHREINKTPDGMHTDHVNGNKLDNTRANLRTATPSQNQQNRSKLKEKCSVFKGVSFKPSRSKKPNRPGCWEASIKLNGKKNSLGHFVTELDAAFAYNLKATEAWGEYAKLNVLPLDFIRDNSAPKVFCGRKHSKYRGVSWSTSMNKWMAYFHHAGKRVHVSFHPSEDEAAAKLLIAKADFAANQERNIAYA